MALTGLVIVGFLFGHAAGNLQYFLGPDAYNTYAAALQGLGEILWAIRGFLIVCIILHIISAVYLRLYNNAAKPTHYKVKKYVKSKLTARTMLWTGIMILAGVTLHLLHFTTGTIQVNDGYNNYEIVSTGHYAIACDDDECDDVCEKTCERSCEKVCPTDARTFPTILVCASDEGTVRIVFPCGSAMSVADFENLIGRKIPENYIQLLTVGTVEGRENELEEANKFLEEISIALFKSMTAKKTECSDACPEGDEMCGTCKLNPEQCSKYKGATVAKNCNKVCGKNHEVVPVIPIACSILDEGNTSITTIREKDKEGNLIVTIKKSGDKYCAFIDCAYNYKIDKRTGNLTILNSDDDAMVILRNFYKSARLADCEYALPVVKERHDVHAMVTAEFSNVCVALLYILFVILVGFHLNHAIQSAFHTLGIEGPKFTPIMRLASIGLAVILVGLFSVLPFGVIVSNLFGIDLVNIISCITGGCL